MAPHLHRGKCVAHLAGSVSLWFRTQYILIMCHRFFTGCRNITVVDGYDNKNFYNESTQIDWHKPKIKQDTVKLRLHDRWIKLGYFGIGFGIYKYNHHHIISCKLVTKITPFQQSECLPKCRFRSTRCKSLGWKGNNVET